MGEPYAAVRCHGNSVPGVASCGLVDIDHDEYYRQMCQPDSVWCCPNCGSTASFNEDRYDELQSGLDLGGVYVLVLADKYDEGQLLPFETEGEAKRYFESHAESYWHCAVLTAIMSHTKRELLTSPIP
jgi:hypothetical protein